jgi:GAF domain-containing protein
MSDSNDENNSAFDQQLLKAENRIAKAISKLFNLEDILHDICHEIKLQLDFDFVSISLVFLSQNTVEAIYGIGIAESWANRSRHYLEEEEDLRDIQADIVKTARTEIIAGWDNRFDRWIYNTFRHDQINRIFTPILLVRNIKGEVVEDWFENFDWINDFVPQPSDEKDHTVIDINLTPDTGSHTVIGTIEAGYKNRCTPIPHEKVVNLAKLAAKYALEIRQMRLRCVLELIAENAKQILQADLITLHFLLDSHQSYYIYQVRSGSINDLVPEKFPPRLNEQGIGWQAIHERCPKFVVSNIESYNPVAHQEGSRSYAAFPLLIDDNKQKLIRQATATNITPEDNLYQEDCGSVVGVLYVHFKSTHELTENEKGRGKFIAERAVDAIWQAMTYQQVRDKARQLEALHSVTQSINQVPENADLLEHIAWNTLNVLAADIITIYAYRQTEKQFLTPPSIAGRFKEERKMKTAIQIGEIPFVLIEYGEPIYLSHIQDHEIFRHSPFAQRENIQAVAGILLKVDEDIVGVMFINYRRRHNFSKEEKKIIKTLASSAAAAIKNQRWMQTLSDIDREIITTLEPSKLVNLIVKRAVQMTGADLGVIRRLEPMSQDLIAQAIYPPNEVVEHEWERIKIGTGIAGTVALNQKPELIEDVQQDSRYISYFSDTLSELCVPILGKESADSGVIGVLNVESRRKIFTQRDLQRLEVLADLAVIAIQNAESKEKFASMKMMATLGDLTSQLLHRMKPDIGALRVFLREAIENLDHGNDYVLNEMERLINRISQNLGRMKGWRQEEPQCLRIEQVIFDTLKRVEKPSNIDICMETLDILPEVLAGEQQLIGIFDNLIQNAIDSMPNGGTLSISGLRGKQEPQCWAKIEITDTGYGISKDNLDKIFQLGFSTKSILGNMGFGLWWTQIQVESLGGHLVVDSNVDSGTKFTIILPAHREGIDR